MHKESQTNGQIEQEVNNKNGPKGYKNINKVRSDKESREGS